MSLPPNDSLLAAKIQAVLQKKPDEVEAYAHANERYLVVLVLLTRLRDTDVYVTFWDSHPELVSFCSGLILSASTVSGEDSQSRRGNDTNDGESLELYYRLIAQFQSRCRS
jgi:hypothetical protein